MRLHPQARALLERLGPSEPPDLRTLAADRAQSRAAALAEPDRVTLEHVADLDDVQTAARWLRSHGAEHDVDATWLPGIGHSAGANLRRPPLSTRGDSRPDASSHVRPVYVHQAYNRMWHPGPPRGAEESGPGETGHPGRAGTR